ncbi:uncharacterized protein V6R79_023609 [Siganus canaliculatus]
MALAVLLHSPCCRAQAEIGKGEKEDSLRCNFRSLKRGGEMATIEPAKLIYCLSSKQLIAKQDVVAFFMFILTVFSNVYGNYA